MCIVLRISVEIQAISFNDDLVEKVAPVPLNLPLLTCIYHWLEEKGMLNIAFRKVHSEREEPQSVKSLLKAKVRMNFKFLLGGIRFPQFTSTNEYSKLSRSPLL